jgi:hypothetical protein
MLSRGYNKISRGKKREESPQNYPSRKSNRTPYQEKEERIQKKKKVQSVQLS